MSKDRPLIAEYETQLARTLGEFDITMIGVGAMIGAGVFVLTGIAAGVAGPALMLAFALNGVVTIFTAMVYAELGSAIPEAGGGYLWVKEALGKSNGFLAGWMSWFSHAVAGSLYALGFGSFLALLLHDLGIIDVQGPWVEKSIGVLIALAFLYINYRGASETGLAGNIVTLAKVGVIGIFILFGLLTMTGDGDVLAKFQPFFPEGVGAVFVAMGITFIAFEGYEIIVQAGEEVRDPRRSIPRAVFKSLMIVIPIYVLVAITALGAVTVPGMTSWEFLGIHEELGLAEAARRFMPLGTLLLLLGGLLSTTSALNATTFSSTRVSFAMGRDRVLPAFFSKVHERTKTPYMALSITGVLIIFMVLAIPIEDVAAAADVMFLLLFLQVDYAAIKLRREFGDRLQYGYRMPFFPLVPILGIATQAFLAVYLFRFSPLAWLAAGVWILLGLGIYSSYSRGRLEEFERPRIAYEVKRGARKRRTILVPVADTTHVDTSLAVAVALSRHEEAHVIALNVVRIPSQLPLSSGLELTQEAQPVMERVAELAERFPDATIDSIVGVGHRVSQVITDIAQREEADTIVLGWQGTVHESRVRGSVAQAVVAEAPTDLLVIKDHGLPEQVGELLLGVSPGLRAGTALSVAIQLARGFGARLRLVTILLPHGQEKRADLERWLEELAEQVRSAGLPAEQLVTEVIEGESVIRTLAREGANSDLLVIGASRDWVLRQHLLGSIPDRLANRLGRTIVMVKEKEPRVLSLWREASGR
ncbi:MAG: amino acid permease, partial [Actinomycetota bacterium]|nr:amino acid permease [Actinomycetota bacterium]